MPDKKIPVILDCDTGVDDAIAIILALGNPKLDVKGICTVFGNKPLPETTKNTLDLIEFLGRPDVPVAAGADEPLLRFREVWTPPPGRPSMHGKVGIGDVVLPEAKRAKLSEKNAVDFIADVVRESSDPVTLVPVGRMTNIALFLHCYPELKKKVKCIAMMGGGAYTGNGTATTEANISGDPEAAAMIFRAGVPVMMAGLDVTMKAYCTKEDREEFRAVGGEIAAFAADCLIPYAHIYEKIFMHPGPGLHDSVPVAWLIDPDMVETVPAFVEVDLWGEYTYGCTNTDFEGRITGRECNTDVGMEINRGAYIGLITEAIRHLTANKNG